MVALSCHFVDPPIRCSCITGVSQRSGWFTRGETIGIVDHRSRRCRGRLLVEQGIGSGCHPLVKPLAQITLSVNGLMTEKDLLNQVPSFPRIYDGACLGFLWGAGAATAASTTFAGSVECAWG